MFKSLPYLLYPDAAAPAAGGAAPAAAAASPAPAASPSAEPIAAAAAAAPAAGLTPAGEPLIAKVEPAAAAVSVDDQRKYLSEKGGKAEDLAKLSDADLQKQYDAAKGAEAALAAVKPEDITVTLSEGVTLDEKTMGDFKAIVADPKLTTQERAQKLADLHVSALKGAAEAPYKLWAETQTKWQGEVKADKELGGTNFDTMRSTIAKAITDVGGPDADAIFEAFKYTGAANNPAIVRLVYRMSKALVEGDPVAGGAPADLKDKGFAASVAAMYPSATGSAAKAA